MMSIRNLKNSKVLPASPTLLNRLNINSPGYIEFRNKELLNKQCLDIVDPRLRPYQTQAANFLIKSHNTGLAIFDEQRLGKTPTVLSALKAKTAKAIIVVPKSLLYQWYNEYKTWYNDKVLVVDGDKKKRYSIYSNCLNSLIVSYNTLSTDIDEIKKLKHFDYIVIDEAHRIRNLKNSQKTKPKIATAVLTMAKQIKCKIALTGTPAPNLADDIFGILSFLYPDLFSSYYYFRDYYFTTEEIYTKNKNGNIDIRQVCTGEFQPHKKEELLEFLETISIQRKRKEVMKWLPKYNITKMLLPMVNAQQKAYDTLSLVWEYKDTCCLSPLELMLAQRQLTIAPEILECNSIGCKFEFIQNYIKDYPEKSIIIVCTLVEPLEKLRKLIPNHLYITGSTSSRNRDIIKSDFQSKKYKLMLANLDVIKEGFTLDAADTIIFLNCSFTYTDNLQCMDRLVPVAEDRVHSNDQEIIMLLAKNSVDEYIDEMVFKIKASSSDIINNYKNIIERKK